MAEISKLDMGVTDSEQQSKSLSRTKRVTNAAIVAAAGGTLVFEQSPLNEALRVNVGLDVLQNTGSAVAVGLVIAGITTVIEGVSSGLITMGLHSKGGAVQKLKNRRQEKTVTEKPNPEAKKPRKETSVIGRAIGKVASSNTITKMAHFGADVGIALGLGAGLVTVKHHVSDSNPTVKKDLVTSAKATAIVSGVSGTIGYLAGGGIANAEKVGLETPAQYVIDYGTDTRFWMSVLAIGYGGYFISKGIKKVRGDNKPQEVADQRIELVDQDDINFEISADNT